MKFQCTKLELFFIGDADYKFFLNKYRKRIITLMKYFQTLHHLSNYSTISIKIVNDEEIKFLNKKFRKKNSITDVISFGDEGFSGDIAITKSYIMTKGEYSVQNFFMLLTHGMLHLFQFNHYDKKNRQTMRILENICMISLGLKKTHEI